MRQKFREFFIEYNSLDNDRLCGIVGIYNYLHSHIVWLTWVT